MSTIWIALLVLAISIKTNCDLELRILRNIDENYSLVTLGVEESAGNNLTLSCELSSSQNKYYDDQIIWGKSKFKNKTEVENLMKRKAMKKSTDLSQKSDVNRAELMFTPLRNTDEGLYFCGSWKFGLFQVIEIVVRDAAGQANNVEKKSTGFNGHYCNEKMFKCKSSGFCISQHYMCDKKVDCTDGSDESWETCNGDPCKDKLPCKDRCIPMYWCCNKVLDPQCNVTFPPECCQLLTHSYEELEYGYVPYNMTQVRNNGRTRYIFISLCILATFFSIILMLLILLKLEEVGVQFRSTVPCSYRARNIITNARYNCATDDNVLPSDVTNGTVDALLILSDEMIRYGDSADRPPSYSDIMSQVEPPPPYTSQDCLNRT